MTVFGAKTAVAYVVLGLVLAGVGGTVIERMHMEEYVESFVRSAGSVDLDAPELTVRDASILFGKSVRSC